MEVTKDLVHLEDDWYYIQDDYCLLKALQIMQENARVAQVLFNEDFLTSNLPYERRNLAPGQPKSTKSGLPYVLHSFVGFRDSQAYAAMLPTLDYPKNYYWVHYFSLQPGVWRLSALREVGAFHEVFDFEFRYGIRYLVKRWKTVFLPGIRALHLEPSAELANDLGGAEAVDKLFQLQGLYEFSVHMASSAYTLGKNIR